MDVGAGGRGNGNGGGGFSGYRRTFPHSNSGMRLPDIGIGLMPVQTSTKMNGNSPSPATAGAAAEADQCIVREQDRFMPIANVIRIMRKILPPHAKISDDAKETIQECVSEYISFITGEANERCQREQRKTITAEDVLWAMSKLGFDDYIEPLTLYLHRHREFDCGERGSLRGGAADPLGKRPTVDQYPAATLGIAPAGAYGPVPLHFNHLGHHHHAAGFFAAAVVPANGFLGNHHSSSSQEQAVGVEDGEQAFGQCKE